MRSLVPRPVLPTVVLALAVAASWAQGPIRDPLAKARASYNASNYDQAIAAAGEAAKIPKLANPANVVLARSHLERFRTALTRGEQAPVDLIAARDALKLVDVSALTARDRVEFLTGLGESLYLEDQPGSAPLYGAAAEIFARALNDAMTAAPDSREDLFEWWAASTDREAQLASDTERHALYTRLVERAEHELDARPQSASALYWIAAGARGMDEVDRAYGAAVAAWIRAPQLGPSGVHLRDDLDRLMTTAIVPERARQMSSGADAHLLQTVLQQQWDDLKQRWQK